MFYPLARHLPGLGGPLGFDELTIAEGRTLFETLKKDMEREAAAIKAGRT